MLVCKNIVFYKITLVLIKYKEENVFFILNYKAEKALKSVYYLGIASPNIPCRKVGLFPLL
jgi:hypothetical protein